LAHVGVIGERRQDRIGVWVRRAEKGGAHEDKIAAIGIRIKRWGTLHGVPLNIHCDLSPYAGIVPRGGSEPAHWAPSLADARPVVTMTEIDALLQREFERLFGPVARNQAATDNLVPSLPAI